jgi:ligand-binding sensor domain-containing protein
MRIYQTLLRAIGVEQLLSVAADLHCSQSSEIPFELIGVIQGLSNSTVTVIAQDWTGFIWVGTEDGLDWFNGLTMSSFSNDPRDVPQSPQMSPTPFWLTGTGPSLEAMRDEGSRTMSQRPRVRPVC